MTIVDPITLQRLALAHGCRFDALAANRAGQMTREQARGLRKDRHLTFIVFAVATLVLRLSPYSYGGNFKHYAAH